ncbi:hypothetical protein [Methylobacterium sp. SyP6R]|uniref:hypothetical protein n=1 Tax=Methylobacterium sp. SyP6R TaxID=2718876 RepID=UPI001F29768A|nr:hypothetical protein [Methylobacterium sp. SyP6R]MCF4124971.1 hypothetical protein [Methylobacterium sp. SyP6R]
MPPVAGAGSDSRGGTRGGSAAINGAFLKAGLIDEISVLIHPAVDGLTGVESFFCYQGDADERPGVGQALRHFATETPEGRYGLA